MNPDLLLAILRAIKSNVVLAIQLSDNIYETVHYFPKDDNFFDVTAEWTTYEIQDNNLVLNSDEYSLENIIRLRLVDRNFVHLCKSEFIAECETFPSESGPIAHGEGIVFNRNARDVYVGNHHFGERVGFGRCYSGKGNLVFEGEFANNLFARGRKFDANSVLAYEGNFDGYDKHGSGTLYDGNRCYVGYFGSGFIVGYGFGVRNRKNGVYIGEYKNNHRHGWGMNMTSTYNFVGRFDSGHCKDGTMYWKPKASYPYFGPATYTEMKWDNKTHIGILRQDAMAK